MSLYSYEIDNISRDEWHRLISGFNDTLLEQAWSYATAPWRMGSIIVFYGTIWGNGIHLRKRAIHLTKHRNFKKIV